MIQFLDQGLAFSTQRKVQLFDATIQTFDLDTYQADVRHQLLIKRSALNVQSEPLRYTSYRPDLSHFSSAIGFGRSYQGTTLRFRSAFHELVQPHKGLIPFSHVEVGSFSIIHSDLLHSFFLEQLTISKLANFNPWDRVHRELSWKMNFSLNTKLRPDLEVGFGFTHGQDDSDQFRFAALLGGNLKSSTLVDGDQRTDLFLGPEFIAMFHPTSRLGLYFSAKPCQWSHQQCFEAYEFKSNFNFFKNYDFQINIFKDHQDRYISHNFPLSSKGISYQANLMVNFLL